MAAWKGKEIDHLSLRLFALLIAVLLWFLATSRPQRTVSLDQRTVQVEAALIDVDDALEITATPEPVEVTLEGPRLILPFQAQDVRAYIDMANVGAGRHRLPVRVEAPSGIAVRAVVPSEVSVSLEERARRTVPVRLALRGVPQGAGVRAAAASLEEMDVYGAASAVEQVEYIAAEVVYGEPKQQAPLAPVDALGRPVPGVVTIHDFLDVELEFTSDDENLPSDSLIEPDSL